ncbi:zinc finger protein ZPR1-like [Juglans microcarpa x Juglans regia]|uniref:zinc finger protein ZPR1-like n=1 Tax=Juglans microcarpa x Juglans regia TaxID=2249226 RepID=UPI001B7E9C4B|nr:zinc finger protein ZPR1-like [Juglans microcarpa x Juglans regia]
MERAEMEPNRNKEQIVDVRSVVEAVSADDNGAPLYQVESLCMRCGENGITRFLLTLIPHFRKILLSAFECPHCGERNNEVQFAGEILPRGCCYHLEVPSGDPKMLNRQVVKSESATIKIPELDFEIPPEAQRGSLSTVEGILLRAADELQALQEDRKKVNHKTAEAIDKFLLKLKACATGDSPFTFILDDPAGNSFIENPFAPSTDPSLIIRFYERTPEQQASLGYLVDPSHLEDHRDGASAEEMGGASDEVRREPHGSVGATAAHRAIAHSNSAEIVETMFKYSAPEEVMTFPSTCGGCASRCETRMFVTHIPYFQEVIVMASICDACGYRSSELKPGGRIPEKGKRISLTVNNVNDLSRDIIKSDTAGVKIPELDLELASGTLGGVVTTVEGLITKISESLERVHGFTFGDSLDESKRSKWQEFKAKLNKLLSLEEPWTLILDDALANSFVAPVTEDIKDDLQLAFEEYERSWEQNEELGLNDIDTSSADAAYNSTDTKMGEKSKV